MAQDKITHLLAAWPHTTHVGENLRLDQQTPSYRQLELTGDFDGCWEILEKTLRSYSNPPAQRRRRAQAYWSAWQWPADNDIKSFHTLLRRALMACKRNNIPKQDFEVVMRYLELVPQECAIYLEDPLRAPPGGWELGPMMQEAEAYFELRKVYSQDASGGLPGNGRKLSSPRRKNTRMLHGPMKGTSWGRRCKHHQIL